MVQWWDLIQKNESSDTTQHNSEIQCKNYPCGKLCRACEETAYFRV